MDYHLTFRGFERYQHHMAVTTSFRWILPLLIVFAVAAAFVLYSFVYSLSTVRIYPTYMSNTSQKVIHLITRNNRAEDKANLIAILIPATTRKIRESVLNLGTLSLTKDCIPSIKKTVEQKFQYNLYIGTEFGDYLETQKEALQSMSSANVRIIPMIIEGGTYNKVVDAIATRAYDDGAEYLVRINDDTLFTTNKWTSLGIAVLDGYKPPKVGVVGPTCRQGNTAILTHDMVHRTHIDIFKHYYPMWFENWYTDRWITEVYKPNRSTKSGTWVVKHTMGHGTRYHVDHSKQKLKQLLIMHGKYVIEAFVGNESNRSRLVVSYSLFGDNRTFTDGAIENAQLLPKIYPGWKMRVYYDETVPNEVVEHLRQRNVELVLISGLKDKMTWRFLVASDPTVQRYIIRDTNSRLSLREKAAVEDWIKSRKRFHIMRDHPSQSKYPVSGGLWGGTREAVPDMLERLQRFQTNKIDLQTFLNAEIWEIAKKSLIQHDSFSCEKYNGSVPFPVARTDWEYVGSKFINGEIPQTDVDLLKKTEPPKKCLAT